MIKIMVVSYSRRNRQYMEEGKEKQKRSEGKKFFGDF